MKIVVYLTAGCGPSQQMSKALKEHKKELGIEVVVIDADPARVEREIIKGIPCIKIYDNDKLIKTFVGYNKNIIKRIKGVINGT